VVSLIYISLRKYQRKKHLLNFDKNKVFGSDGCNRIAGTIEQIDERNLVFGAMMGTKMACPDMGI